MNCNSAQAPLLSRPMYKKKEIVSVKILDIADKNQCFGRLDDGMSIFVQGAVAVGDTVKAEIFKIKKKFLVARFKKLLEPSPHRIEPICSYFGLCGGCKWQHMEYTEQLRLKQKQVQDALEHLGHFSEITCEECIPAPHLFGYRNKMDFSFTDLRYLTPDEMELAPGQHQKPLDFALGFHAPGCYAKAIDIDHCDLSTELMNVALNTTRAFCLKHKDELPIYSTRSHTGELRNLVVRHGGNTDEFMVNLVTSTHNPTLMKQLCADLRAVLGEKLTTFVNSTTSAKNTVAFSEKEFVLHGEGFITDRLGNYTYRISPNSFFQTNTAQAEILYEKILEIAQIKPTDIVYDLFCGTGSITLFAAPHCKKILGIELVESSILDARKNAKRHQIENATFIQLDLKEIKNIQQEMADFGSPDVVITDPPRAGMNPKAVKALLEIAPPTILYVSCNPASLARDGEMLCENGDYKLVHAQPIDLFPQTNHVETIARFEHT